MVILRWLILLLLVGGLGCLAIYAGTGERRWFTRGTRIIKWTVIGGLVFFAVLIAERVKELW